MRSKNKLDQDDKSIGIFEMTGCKGCEIAVSNQKEQIREIAKIITFPMESNEINVERMDIALVEGQVASHEDLDLLRDIREKAKYLVAIGTCATEGNYPEAVDEYGVERSIEEMEVGSESNFTPLEESGCLEDFVEVDYYIRGCPVREKELIQFLEKFKNKNFHKNENLQLPLLTEDKEINLQSSAITYDPNKCILCRRCVNVCNEIMDVNAIGISDRGPEANVSTPFEKNLEDSGCIYCGQCVENCPVGAFDVNSSVRNVLELLDKENTVVIVDPVSLVSIGEVHQSLESGLNRILSKLISAFRELGADKVLDYSSYLQLSAVGQAELLENGEKIISSWCPSSRLFIEKNLTDLQKYLFEETFPESLLSKRLNSEHGKEGFNTILISPCIAQKRNDLIDTVISPREISQLLGAKNIWLDTYTKSDDFDGDLKPRSRKMLPGRDDFAYTPYILKILDKLSSSDSKNIVDSEILGKNVKEYTLRAEGNSYSGLVVEELARTKDYLKNGEFDIIELIPCPGGCVTGGGQFPTSSFDDVEVRFEKLEKLNKRVKPSKSSFSDLIEDYKNIMEGS